MPQNRHFISGIVSVLVLAAMILMVLGGCGNADSADSDAGYSEAEIAAGVAYLQALEARDPNEVDEKIKELHQQRFLELRAERLAELEADEDSVWSLFEDYVLLGDSRAVGFYYYGFLPESRVMAESGATILRLEEHIPDLEALRPTYLFLCYGLNDVSIGIWPTPEEYADNYAEIIAEVREALPDVQIYISSILPARDPAFATSSKWYEIPNYSAAVQKMCEETGCVYVDNDEISEEYADLWQPDGIHLQPEFYSHWAANMMLEVYSSSLEDELELS